MPDRVPDSPCASSLTESSKSIKIEGNEAEASGRSIRERHSNPLPLEAAQHFAPSFRGFRAYKVKPYQCLKTLAVTLLFPFSAPSVRQLAAYPARSFAYVSTLALPQNNVVLALT